MSSAEEISLLGHLDTPILVGDPEGHVVYANPSFRRRFCVGDADPTGQSLANVFGGGSREVVLKVTADVLTRGQAARLQIREGGIGYTGLASPIEAEDDRVGVVMVMLEEQSNEDHLAGLADEIAEPIGDAQRAFARLLEAPSTPAGDEQRVALERGLHAVETAQKWLRELQLAIRGGKSQQGRFDVAASVLRTAERLRSESDHELALEVLMPPNLPRAMGSGVAFERALLQLARQRLAESLAGRPITLLARALGGDGGRGLVVSVVDVPDTERRGTQGQPPESLVQLVQSMGGEVACVEDSLLGRVTALRLAAAGS
ncbi:PAS domain-containing protein [Myxococcota bacterium]|nr:PAS domain-containing protein [Myxococcota bacterium]